MSMAKLLPPSMESGPHVGFNNLLVLIIYDFFKVKEKRR